MPVTSSPSRIREVTPASAASVVIPSNVSPGPSPYIGWKWSNPQTPSKPSSSASCTRRTSSSHEIRCWATSSPKRMVRDSSTPREGGTVEDAALYLPDGDGFVGTELTQGGWDPGAQNGAVVLALLGHCLEDVPTLSPMGLARLTVDLMRPVPIGPRLVVRPSIVREGKKIQVALLELVADDVVHVRATALRVGEEDLGDEGQDLLPGPPPIDRLPAPEGCARVGDAPGAPGFLRGIEMRRAPDQGVWIRLAVPVV